MLIRPATTISALLLGVTLTAPAWAVDSVASNKGPAGSATATRDAPLALPGTATATPTPRVDGSTLSRGLPGLDAEAALASMGTITRAPDGTVTETPASPAMRGLVEEEIKSASNGLTAGTVVGKDDRRQITESHQFPQAVIGWLWMQDQQGNWSSCTASLIGPQTIITAAHCVYKPDAGGFAQQGQFYPGVVNGKDAPFGTFDVTYMNILKGYVDNFDGKNYGSSMPWDLAEIELSSDAGNQIGWLGWGPDKGVAIDATLMGYPADKPQGTMWQQTCHVDDANFGETVFWHNCDTSQGASGGPLFTTAADGNVLIHGINVAEDDTRNYAVRLTGPFVQFLSDNYK